MKDGVRIAVVGTGAIAQLTHIPVLSKLRGAKLVALCDNDAAKARALADRFDVPDVFTDFEELLDIDELDAVIIATPNHLHEPHVLAALRKKLHVLCERPLSLTTRGIERCLAAAQKALADSAKPLAISSVIFLASNAEAAAAVVVRCFVVAI